MNKTLTFNQNGVDVLSIDGNNQKIVMKDFGITMLGALESDINMNGKTITNLGQPEVGNSVATKDYVDGFID